MSHDESSYRRRRPEPGRDVVARDDVRLQVGREGEDRDPGGEDVSECIHLRCHNFTVSFTGVPRMGARIAAARTNAEVYARFSGSSRFVSFTHVHVMPAHVPDSAVRSAITSVRVNFGYSSL